MTGQPEHIPGTKDVQPAAEPQKNILVRLNTRDQFVAVSKGQRAFCKGLIVQALPQHPINDKEIRVGFTCSKIIFVSGVSAAMLAILNISSLTQYH